MGHPGKQSPRMDVRRTLYVVTGCYFDGTEGTTTDNGGNPCPVPTHYYKVLLRTKQGTTGQPVTTLAAD